MQLYRKPRIEYSSQFEAMRAARKALLHAKDFILITDNSQVLRLHAGDDPATLLLTMAVHNEEFRYLLEAVLNQANETLDAESESDEPSDN